MSQHLTVRVTWHQEQWNDTVCRGASNNSFCLELDRIREERDDAHEDRVGGKLFTDFPLERLPPCRARRVKQLSVATALIDRHYVGTRPLRCDPPANERRRLHVRPRPRAMA
jgi:hypothetical protein